MIRFCGRSGIGAILSTDLTLLQNKCVERWGIDIPADLYFSKQWKLYFKRRHTTQSNVEVGRRNVRSLRGHTSFIVGFAVVGRLSVAPLVVTGARTNEPIVVINRLLSLCVHLTFVSILT